MRNQLLIFALVCWTTSCSGGGTKANDKILFEEADSCQGSSLHEIVWDNISIKQLPYQIGAFDDWNNLFEIQNRIRNAPNDQLSGLFGEPNIINERLYSGSCIDSTAHFFRRLPDINGFKVIIFEYLNADDFETYPTYSIQTIDSNNICIDKLVVSSVMPGGNSWKRNFLCDEDYMITICDSIQRMSSDDGSEGSDKVEYSRCDTYSYIVNRNGYFVRYYSKREGNVEEYLLDDYSDIKLGIYREKGTVQNHLRDGIWLISKKNTSNNNVVYVQDTVMFSDGEVFELKSKD